MAANPTGYGPSTEKYRRLIFDGNPDNFEIWETRFLAHMRALDLKATIQADVPDVGKNARCYAELVNLIDDKSLALVMREAADDGKKAVGILRQHYAGVSKPRIIALYTELTTLTKNDTETVTDYIIRAEKSMTSLRSAKETVSDGLMIAMILKGLPSSFKPFAINISQSSGEDTWIQFKTKLRSFEETENISTPTNDNIMHVKDLKTETVDIRCYACGQKGHFARNCQQNASRPQEQNTSRGQYPSKWCNYHKSKSHSDAECRVRSRNNRQSHDEAKQACYEDDEQSHSYAFKISDTPSPRLTNIPINKKGLLVDTGATSHIITTDTLKNCDNNFNPETHFMELANGTRMNNVVKKIGDAEMMMPTKDGNIVQVTLKNALYIPSYPHNIFSVKAATKNGAEIKLKHGHNLMMTKDRTTTFDIEEYDRLYYLKTVSETDQDRHMKDDRVNLSLDIKEWHEILGHCNLDDIRKLENVVQGMHIKKGKLEKTMNCNTCTEGKFANTRNRTPDARATKPLELIHTDLAGPMNVPAKDQFKYAISFTDDYSGAIFIYFLRNKSDTIQATEKFLADSAPYGNVKCIRSDNGGEYTSSDFESLLRRKQIRHDTSAPHSPHQNGTAERNWRTLFEMARCLLFESGLPKYMWTYAVKMAAYIRNRCYNNRTQQTPHETLTGKKPDLSKMWIFGSECYAYTHYHKKLDPRCSKGTFVGYDTNSPAYLVYYPNGKVLKHRLVKFVRTETSHAHTQTSVELPGSNPSDLGTSNLESTNSNHIQGKVDNSEHDTCCNEKTNESQTSCDKNITETKTSSQQTTTTCSNTYPQRTRNPPKFLDDYVTMATESKHDSSVDFCYKTCGDPQNYREAIDSPQHQNWKQAMDDEIKSLQENNTYELVNLPEGKTPVGGRWVYVTKEDAKGMKSFKARYVAKGYTQVQGIDYKETFSPTANITSVRALMQIAAQNDLIVHQMDVKTAFLHAPIDEEIYMEQPEGFVVKSSSGDQFVYKLKKSLYGLKQSGRNWNKVLHDHLCTNGFTQNPVDHCVYKQGTDDGVVLVIIWVDDILIAASNETLMNQFKDTMKVTFRMKDLGKISYFLGIDFKQTDGKITMSQERYITKMIEKFGMSDCKPRSTPCECKPDDTNQFNNECVDPTKYREIVGSLIYAATCTRPDIAWAVSKLSQHLSKPKYVHLTMAKHVLRYLKGTLDYELVYERSSEPLQLIAFSDADWASSVEDRKSTTGYCFSLTKNGAVISWKSKKQPTVALSTCEAEYMGLGSTTQESLYLIHLMQGMDDKAMYNCVTIFEDNQGAIALSKNPVNRQRSKHIDIRYHFVRNALEEGKVDIQYCPTEDMIADSLTKPMSKFKLQKFKNYLFGS